MKEKFSKEEMYKILKEYEEVIVKIRELYAKSLDSLNPEPILVPENIKITKRWCDCSYGLQFGNNQELYWDYEGETWSIRAIATDEEIQTQLIPCEREDLKAGDLAFRADEKEPYFNQRPFYCLITNEEPVWIESNFPKRDCNKYNYWYKVVKL